MSGLVTIFTAVVTLDGFTVAAYTLYMAFFSTVVTPDNVSGGGLSAIMIVHVAVASLLLWGVISIVVGSVQSRAYTCVVMSLSTGLICAMCLVVLLHVHPDTPAINTPAIYKGPVLLIGGCTIPHSILHLCKRCRQDWKLSVHNFQLN